MADELNVRVAVLENAFQEHQKNCIEHQHHVADALKEVADGIRAFSAWRFKVLVWLLVAVLGLSASLIGFIFINGVGAG